MTALLDAVASAAATETRLYALGSVPASPTYPYAVYSAAFGPGNAYGLDSTFGVREGRVTLQAFGRTADSTLSLMDRLVALFLDRRLPVDGWATTPLRVELAPTPDRDPDDTGVIGATATLTFTATKES